VRGRRLISGLDQPFFIILTHPTLILPNSHQNRYQDDNIATSATMWFLRFYFMTPVLVTMALLVLGMVQGVVAAAETDSEFALNLFSDLAP